MILFLVNSLLTKKIVHALTLFKQLLANSTNVYLGYQSTHIYSSSTKFRKLGYHIKYQEFQGLMIHTSISHDNYHSEVENVFQKIFLMTATFALNREKYQPQIGFIWGQKTSKIKLDRQAIIFQEQRLNTHRQDGRKIN